MNTRFLSLAVTLLALTFLAFRPSLAVAQDGGGGGGSGNGAEVLRGRVVTPDGKPIANASVTVIGLESKIERKTKTNDKGVYTVLFTNGEGEYIVTIRALGYAPMKQRVLDDGTQMGNVLVTDFSMTHPTTELAAVNVKGHQANGDADKESVGDAEEDIDLERGRLFSLDPSDLSTLMQGMPGVTYIPGKDGKPGSYSVLGSSPDENSTLVDGMEFDGQRLPPDAIAGGQLSTATYDAARGGFSGGQASYHMRSGTNIWQGNLSSTFFDPRLSWVDPNYPTPLARNLDFSASTAGPLIKNKVFYFGAFQMTRQSHGLQSILNIKDIVAQQQGLIPDTVAAVSQALQQLGIPLTTGAIPDQQVNLSKNASMKVDLNPTATTAMSVLATGSWTGADGNGIGPTTYPVAGSGQHSMQAMLGLRASTYFTSILNEFNISLNRQTSANAPYVLLPGGSVLLPQRYNDGPTGLTPLRFGGASGSGRTSSNATSLSIHDEVSFLTTDSRHQYKLSTDVRTDRTSTSAVSDQFGTFSYQSLNDLTNNQPTSYSRTLSSHAKSVSTMGFGLSLGDQWRASPEWSFQYGVRLDLSRSGTQPAYNPLVDSLFQQRTDRVPKSINFSPRLGFQWVQGGGNAKQRRRPPALRHDNRGMLMMQEPPITVSGGLGAFQSGISAQSIASLADATGLANTIRQLTCVGDATPIPDWTAFSTDPNAVPSNCLDGTAPVEFSTNKPNVTIYSPSYRAPLSWNANLNVNGIHLKGWTTQFRTDFRMALNQQSHIDLNLRRSPLFDLTNEENRPVYVGTSAIVPTTGAVAPGAPRISDQFGSVMENVSDLKMRTVAFTVGLSRINPLFGQVPFNVSYTLSSNRQQFRGFSGSTAGDPFGVEWSNGLMPTHSITVNTDFQVKWFNINARLLFTSGRHYTPMVSGDINGDGIASDDRAFVFDPQQVTDPEFAAQLSSLLENATPLARKCLQQNRGGIAKLNSCATGWDMQPAINISFQGFGFLNHFLNKVNNAGNMGYQHRFNFSITTQNLLSPMWRLIGLSPNSLFARSSQSTQPDQVLMYVDGFDPATQQFKYRINQRFGATTTYTQHGRSRVIYPPLQIGFRGQMNLGGPPYRTFAQGLGLVSVGKQPPKTLAEVKDRLLHVLTQDPVDKFLAVQDSLLLTEQQVTTLKQKSAQFMKFADSLLTPIAQYVEDNGQDTDDKELMKRIGKVRSTMMKTMMETLQAVDHVLTDAQVNRLTPELESYLEMARQFKQNS